MHLLFLYNRTLEGLIRGQMKVAKKHERDIANRRKITCHAFQRDGHVLSNRT